MSFEKRSVFALILTAFVVLWSGSAQAFEGYIQAVSTRGGPAIPLMYTVGTNYILIEPTATNGTSPLNLVDLNAGTVALIYPQNRTYIRFKTPGDNSSGPPPGAPASAESVPPPPPPPPQRPAGPAAGMPGGLPPGGLPPGIGPTNFSAMPDNGQMPARPQMPAMPQRPQMSEMPGGGAMAGMPSMAAIRASERLQLRATGQTTNLLGYTCQGFEIKRHGETMEIWATDQLWPFQGYLLMQPRGVGPPMIEERWSELLAARKLFPLLAELKLDNGAPRYHFEVQLIKPARLTEKDAAKFQVPAEYVQIMARPF